MRKPSNRIPSYCLHKATGLAYATIGGKVIYLGKYKLHPDGRPDCPRYHELIAQWLTGEQTMPSAAAPSSLTVVELIEKYWRHAESYYKGPDGKPTGELDAVRQALRPLNRLFGETIAAEFGPKRLKAVRQAMQGQGWCRTNINRQVKRVQQCFRWAVAEELIPGAVDHALSTVKGLRANPMEVRESDPVKPVPAEAVAAVLPFVSRQVAAMIQLQQLTGMRSGEVIAMRTVDIETTDAGWIYRPAHHKTAHRGIAREIPLGPKAREIVRGFMKPGKMSDYLFSPADAERERRERLHAERKTPASCGNVPGTNRQDDPERSPGTRYDNDSYRRAIARACDEAFPPAAPLAQQADAGGQLESMAAWKGRLTEAERKQLAQWRRRHRWHPHQLRHAAATELRKVADLETARVILGHTGLNMTAHYAEQDRDKARKIMEQVG